MKLIDILARELKEWPGNYRDVGQAFEGCLHLPGIGPHERHTAAKYTSADDWSTAIVTRAEWQAAVDALMAPQVVNWHGNGLPPAGTVCIVTPHNTCWGFASVADCECKVLAYHGDYVWLELERVQLISTRTDKADFTPIRTPEQIVAEERAAAIDAMCKECGYDGGGATFYTCAGLYDAGYRKQVAP